MNICRPERESRKRARTGSARTGVAKCKPLLLPDGTALYLPVRGRHTLASLSNT